MNWRLQPRIDCALVNAGAGVPCEEREHLHFIPGGDTLTIDMNGAARLCSTIREIVRKELSQRLWVRIVRQSGAPEPDSYLSQ